MSGRTHHSVFQFTFIMILAATLAGCHSQRDIPTLPKAHDASWMDQTSNDFHGNVVLSTGAKPCAFCHGRDWNGGSSGVSCIACHSQLVGECVKCHGGTDNQTGAPPQGLRGELSDTTLAVGAHTIHLSGSSWAAAISCDACHLVPAFVADSGHYDNRFWTGAPNDSIAKISWHGFADPSGQAVWNRTTRTCTGTYCHGNFVGGLASNAPIWTAKNQAVCGSCHDFGAETTLSPMHPFHLFFLALQCIDCHGNVIDSAMNVIAPALHVNGVADTLTRDTSQCNKCHLPGPDLCFRCHGGLDNGSGAPPKGLRGETLKTQLAVGAHTVHTTGGTMSAGYDCVECHVKPIRVSDPGHLNLDANYKLDSIAEIVWGGIANPGGAVWDRRTAQCAGTYCHGNFTGGNGANNPTWTVPGPVACNSCHDNGANPISLGGRHAQHLGEGLQCYHCHSATVDANNTIVGKSAHVDGVNTVSFWDGQGSYSAGTCSNPGGCHGSASWFGGGGGRER